MYPLGVLFGLGFDTATEVTLLAISAANAGDGMPIGLVMFLPALFTAGMTLVDTADGIMMTMVYSWATIHPAQKLYYNFTITLMSATIAFTIAFIQLLGIISDRYHLSGGIWDGVASVSDNYGTIGLVFMGAFVSVLIISAALFRYGRNLGGIEQRGFDHGELRVAEVN
ncbi:hypothetical protein HDU87_003831 [Geranomyces variabilis]|uniref:Nickel/cobalt efflux system n=1 Tax=Geranomyces variabilis TaxID=109894 RepID=A0AAD5XQZ8_9FUNG|nr:hypothetical protein HDU87_003831 [Geranomyces variabilis]